MKDHQWSAIVEGFKVAVYWVVVSLIALIFLRGK